MRSKYTRHNKSILTLPLIVAFLALSVVAACSGGDMKNQEVTYSSLKKVPDAVWEKLSKEKIYFGHQSVGFNIIDGIKDLMKENPKIRLNIVETKDGSDFGAGIFAHSRIGKNVDPEAKIKDFTKLIDEQLGGKANAAALKFCYVDMSAKTNVQKVFADYTRAVEELEKKYPHMTIIHFTEPLTTSKTTWKTWIKKIIGKKEIWEYDDNIKRNEYNELLRQKYKGKEPIMDIAEIESTYPDGTRCTFKKDGKTYYSMVPEYTTDGGHLNEIGRKKAAEQFLLLLAGLAS